MKQETWDEWTDPAGNVYRPGDIVAVATVNGKSPQLVIGRVEKINKTNSNGQPILEPGPWDHATKRYLPGVPSCSVQVTPLVDGRGFYRHGSDTKPPRKQTYRFPGNIVKVGGAGVPKPAFEVLQDEFEALRQSVAAKIGVTT